MEDISKCVSRALDHVGYNLRIVCWRRTLWKQYALQENIMKFHKSGRHLLIAGSKAEGVSAFYESDIDHMFVLTDVVCVDSADDYIKSNLTCFLRDDRGSPPGYTKLKLINFRRGENSRLIQNSLYKDADKSMYISSACFMAEQQNIIGQKQKGLDQREEVSYGDSSGPAFPLLASSIKADIVTGFFCEHPNELKTWARRPRYNGWPNSDVIKDISSRGCQLVPIGCRNSELQFRQWRLCFIDTELQLMQSLNAVQIKLYVILKQIAKHVLQSVSQEITSFMMKNVCFWMAELLPSNAFREEKLFELFHFSIIFFKNCIAKWNCLPYYIIPERNLLHGKFSPQEREKLVSYLEDLVTEGPQLFLKCWKLRFAILSFYKEPTQLREYGKKRDVLEILKLILMFVAIANEYKTNVKTGDLCDTLKFKMADIVLPEWRKLRHMGNDVKETIIERVNQMLS